MTTTPETPTKRTDPRRAMKREEVRVYGGTIKTLARLVQVLGQTRVQVVRDALARYEADLIDEGKIIP